MKLVQCKLLKAKEASTNIKKSDPFLPPFEPGIFLKGILTRFQRTSHFIQQVHVGTESPSRGYKKLPTSMV
jgi:hypothetical protein